MPKYIDRLDEVFFVWKGDDYPDRRTIDGKLVVTEKELAQIQSIILEERLEEFKEIQACPFIPDHIKDEIYRVHIKKQVADIKSSLSALSGDV